MELMSLKGKMIPPLKVGDSELAQQQCLRNSAVLSIKNNARAEWPCIFKTMLIIVPIHYLNNSNETP